MIKWLKYFIESIVIYIFFIIIKIIGLHLSRKLFSYIFIKIGPLIKSKNIIENNIERIFKKKINDKKKRKIIYDMWTNYGKVFVEYIYLHKFKKQKSHIHIKGKKNIDDIIKKKKPVIFVSGHFANFELMSMELNKNDINLATIYRPLNNFF